MDDIILDRETFKALAIDSRVDILKSLKERRKTASELSKELKLSVPTISEHLAKMKSAGLILKKPQGKKWIYYELTSKGTKILNPKPTTLFTFALSVSIILIVVASLNLFTLVESPVSYSQDYEVPIIERTITDAASEAEGTVTTAGAVESEDTADILPKQNVVEKVKTETQSFEYTGTIYSQQLSYEFLTVMLIGAIILITSLYFWLKK